MRYLLVAFLALSIFSCKKQDKETTFIGRILKKSDSSAYANTSFILYEEAAVGNNLSNQKVPFTTSSDGSFSVKMNPKSGDVSLCYPDNPTTLVAGSVAGAPGYSYRTTNNVYDFGTVYAK